jgi:hypothetical protein
MNTSNPEALKSKYVALTEGYSEPYHPGNLFCPPGCSTKTLIRRTAFFGRARINPTSWPDRVSKMQVVAALCSLFEVGAWVPNVRPPADDSLDQYRGDVCLDG